MYLSNLDKNNNLSFCFPLGPKLYYVELNLGNVEI